MKKYTVQYSQKAVKDLQKLDKYTQKIIYSWISKNLIDCEDPRVHGKALSANRKGQWRYRIGDYRLICLFQDDELIILALSVGHRRNVYDKE